MLPQLLASNDIPTVVATSPFIFLAVVILAVLTLRYLLYRMKHQQIMAAIEKGLPLPELKMPRWKGFSAATSIALAPAMFIIAVGPAYMFYKDQMSEDAFLGSCIFCGLGIFFLIRGILQRKAEKASSSDKSTLDTNKGN